MPDSIDTIILFHFYADARKTCHTIFIFYVFNNTRIKRAIHISVTWNLLNQHNKQSDGINEKQLKLFNV